MHFLGKIDLKLENKITKYIISRQNKEGGWPLFYNGETDLSAGDLVEVNIEHSDEYDLWGSL